MADDITIRRFEAGDENGIIELDKIVNQRLRSPEEWAWQYRNGPAGPAKIWVGETRYGGLVGHWSWVPFDMQVGGTTFVGAKSEGLMVHPNQRRRGLASRLISGALRELDESEIALIWTFPNTAAKRLLTEHGYRDVGNIQNALVIRAPLKVLAVKTGVYRSTPGVIQAGLSAVDTVLGRAMEPRCETAHTRDVRVVEVEVFDERFDRLWAQVASQQGITLARHSNYLNWRFVKNPYIDYVLYAAQQDEEVHGYIVVFTQRENELSFGYISDLVTTGKRDVDVAAILIRRAMHWFKEQGVDVVCFFLVKESQRYHWLRELSRHRTLVTRPNKTLIVKPNTARSLDCDPTDLENWYVVEGFTEGVGLAK